MDFTADGRFLIASCEFAAKLMKVDVANRKVVGTMTLEKGGMPQDVKTSPDGKVFYVADMMANGIYLIEPDSFTRIGFIPTGKGTHGLYVSRDSKVLYISNRGEGSITVLDLATRKISDEMGNSAWRQSGHGRRFGRWQSAVAFGPLQRGGLCVRYVGRPSAGADQGRERTARAVRLSAAGPIFAGTYRRFPIRCFDMDHNAQPTYV